MRHDGPTGRGDTHTTLATLGLVLLSLACCGLPVLIAAGALGAVGSLLGSPWVIGSAVLVTVGGAAWLIRRRTSTSHAAIANHRTTRDQGEDCCPPDGGPSGHGTDEPTPDGPHR